jgi:hypothetical protein
LINIVTHEAALRRFAAKLFWPLTFPDWQLRGQ